jgi:hypothetical protein
MKTEISINNAIELLADITLGDPITRENIHDLRTDLLQNRRWFTLDEYPDSLHQQRLAAMDVMEKWLIGESTPETDEVCKLKRELDEAREQLTAVTEQRNKYMNLYYDSIHNHGD